MYVRRPMIVDTFIEPATAPATKKASKSCFTQTETSYQLMTYSLSTVTIAEVSSVEGIVLEGPQGLIHQAIEETANKLVSEFQNLGYNWSQQSLRLNTFYGDSTPPARIRVGQVVVDDDTTTYCHR